MADTSALRPCGHGLPLAQKPYALLLDFQWRNLHYLVSEEADSGDRKGPIYDASIKFGFNETLEFTDVASSTVFATSKIHTVSINAECTIRNETFKLEALQRLALRYTHVSRALKGADGTGERLTWESAGGWKTFDWICLDARSLPIARLTANMWALKKVARLEFSDQHSPPSKALREEVVVSALTLYTVFANRINSPFQLVGSVLHSKPKIEQRIVAGNETGDDAAEGGPNSKVTAVQDTPTPKQAS